MACDKASFDIWLMERLTSLGLNDETITDYVMNIVQLDDDLQEKKESLIEFLAAVSVRHYNSH